MAVSIVLYMLALLIFLVLMGFHIAVVLALVSTLGLYLMMGSFDIAISLLESAAYDAIRSEVFIVIPLFVLMGDFVSKSGTAGDLFRLCNRALGRLPGRLAVATVAGNAIFAAVTGVSIASAAAFSRIAYPEMRALGYDKKFALGAVSGSACLGMLIPPSVLLIVWAILTEMSVGALFVAGVIPGIFLALMFAAYCVAVAKIKPHMAPSAKMAGIDSTPHKGELVGAFGILALVVLVIGGIWGGLFNPTEAAGFGAIGALILGVLKGMRWRDVMGAIYSAGRTTAPIMILLITATTYSRLLALGGAVNFLQELILSLGGGVIFTVFIMGLIWLVLGMLIDSVSIILLTVPIFAPIAVSLGVDPLAFAIFGILIIEAGLLTPPFGLLIYTVKGAVPDRSVTLSDIFWGAVPYWIIILIVAVTIVAVPSLASWLPKVAF